MDITPAMPLPGIHGAGGWQAGNSRILQRARPLRAEDEDLLGIIMCTARDAAGFFDPRHLAHLDFFLQIFADFDELFVIFAGAIFLFVFGAPAETCLFAVCVHGVTERERERERERECVCV